MKSYQFSKICKRFYKEREKNTRTAVNEKRKTEESWTFLQQAVSSRSFCSQDFFLFRKLVRSAIFAFGYQDDARNIRRRNWERQIARNCKLQYLFQK